MRYRSATGDRGARASQAPCPHHGARRRRSVRSPRPEAGLIGPNGAGKTTLLKAVLGLTDFEGQLTVLGRDPRRARHRLMEEVSFIADVAILPRRATVGQLLRFLEGTHPRFSRQRGERLLARTALGPQLRVRALSKGLIVQSNLALIMAIDARLLVLEEPTLGRDLLFRRRFYQDLIGESFDGERTILITTHQVEEVEHVLNHCVFLEDGRVLAALPLAEIRGRFGMVLVAPERLAEARRLGPIAERPMFGRSGLPFRDQPREALAQLGEPTTPSLADVFIALIAAEAAR